MRKFKLLFILLLLVITINQSTCAEAKRKKVQFIGFYLDALYFNDTKGKFSGFTYDLIKEIAKYENWDISFKILDFPKLLNFLKTNRDPNINMVSFVAFDKKRTEFINYTNMSILDVVGNVIVSEGNKLNSISELNGKTVVYLKNALPSINFKKLINELHIKCKLIGLQNYTEILEFIDKDPKALLLADNFTFAYNKTYNPKYKNLESALLVLPSFSMRFATRKNMDSDVMERIDYYIDKWKHEPDSPYAKIYEKWGKPAARNVGFLNNLSTSQLLIIPITIALLLLWVFMLRYRVKASTIKIKAREQDLKATLMSIGDGVIVTDTDGSILEINPAGSKILGIDKTSHFSPTEDLILYDRNSMGEIPNPIKMIIDTEAECNTSDICILRNNSKTDYIIAYTASPIFVMNSLKGVVFVFKDVTEAAKSTEKILRSERKLSVILESVNEAILVFDTELILTQVNKYAHNLIAEELGTKEIIGINRADISFYDDLKNTTKPLTESIKTKNNITSINETKSGRIYQVRTSPIINDNGEVINLIQAIMDITELKEKERALRTSEKNYRMLIENQGDIIVKMSPTGNLLFGTASCYEFFGVTKEEFTNHIYRDFIYLDDHNIADEAFNKVLNSQPTSIVEMRHTTLRGIRWVSWQLSRILNDNGEVESVIATGRDITEAKAASEQLKHVQKLEAIGQLAGGVAHDFNNMLGGIVGFAELIMMQSKDNETVKNFSKNIIDTSEKAAELTKQLLAFARKGKASSTAIDAHASINKAVEILKRSITKNIEIELSLNAENSMITGDPSQIQNIILNLGINARDAIGEDHKGKFSIETTVVKLSEEYCRKSDFDLTPQSYLLIKAGDTGVGMEKEVLKHIFEPFFTTKEVGKGTGLGLASIFGTVTSHSGAITATSEPGYGSEFNIFLPLIETDQKLEHQESSTDIISLLAEDAHKVVLVIDDEEIIRMVAKSLLENLGYEVLLAKDGQEGIEVFSVNKDIISIIILDVIMPRMGGKETLRELLEISPEIKVIMASGFSQTDKDNDFIKLGAIDFIHKPYRQKELYRVLKNAVNPQK